jgi:hypothetical protein
MYSTIPIHWNIKSDPAIPDRSRVGQFSKYLSSWVIAAVASLHSDPDVIVPFVQECILEHNAIRKIRLEMDKPDICKIGRTFSNITKTANFMLYIEPTRTCFSLRDKQDCMDF